MENTVLVGLSRQVALSREIEVIANNVANLNTTGFKADGAMFENYLMPVARDDGFSGADSRLNFVQDRATYMDFGQGPIQETGNPLHVALEGKGFLVVQTPNGERYTRNGALQINANGELVTSEGHRVMGEAGPIVFQREDRDVTINSDGSIRVREGANANIDSARGRLRVVDFENMYRVRKDGSSTFMAQDGEQPRTTTTLRVIQGAVEKSNVQGVLEMTRLIEATRAYTDVSGVLSKQGEMRRDTITRLAEVPE